MSMASVDERPESPVDLSLGNNSDNYEDELDMLNERQSIMQRASVVLQEEDHFDAHMARDFPKEHPPSDLFVEAMELLRTLGSRPRAARDHPKPIIPLRMRSRKRPNPTDPTIDNSAVKRYAKAAEWKTRAEDLATALVTTDDMLLSLVHQVSPTPNRHLVIDARDDGVTTSGSLSAVLGDSCKVIRPPFLSCLGNDEPVDISQAMSFTEETRVLTQSLPPYLVVHANKAFYEATGTNPLLIVGQSIESIVQVVQDGENKQAVIRAVVFQKDSDRHYRCRLRVQAVVDRQEENLSHVLITFQDLQQSNTAIVSKSRDSTVRFQCKPTPPGEATLVSVAPLMSQVTESRQMEAVG